MMYAMAKDPVLRKILRKIHARIVNPERILWERIKPQSLILTDMLEVAEHAEEIGATSCFMLRRGNYFNHEIMPKFTFWMLYYDSKREVSIISRRARLMNAFARGKVQSRLRRGIINIIFNEKMDKVLLLKRKSPMWGYEVVKGGIEKGESELDAIIRETYEESGIKGAQLLNSVPIKIYKFYSARAREGDVSLMQYSLYVSTFPKEIKPSFHDATAKRALSGGGWFNAKTAANMIAVPRYSWFVKDAVMYVRESKPGMHTQSF